MMSTLVAPGPGAPSERHFTRATTNARYRGPPSRVHPPPLIRQPIPPHRLTAQWRRQSNLARAHARAHVQRLAACNDERVAGRKEKQARAHGSPTRLRAPEARRGLNVQQPLAAPVQGWRRRRLPLPCTTSASPLPCPVRPPPSALRPRDNPPHPPPWASSLDRCCPEISPGRLSPRLPARWRPAPWSPSSHARAGQRVRRGLSDPHGHPSGLARHVLLVLPFPSTHFHRGSPPTTPKNSVDYRPSAWICPPSL